MLSTIDFANQVYQELTASVDQACKEKYWFIACRPMRVLGFSRIDASTPHQHVQRYELHMEHGIHVGLTYHAADEKAMLFDLPALAQFEVTLMQGEQLLQTYQNAFEQPVFKKKSV
ncbi:hypothetical protein [Methylophilus sp. 3sh_L]|uniref:hypothetical protein n=1 Tax=Methylophilus sp. 3sh_L TaxID=3377114 RepID=UPI00398F5D96